MLCIHIPIKVNSLLQIKMISRLERTLLHRVELHTLHLHLEHRGQFTDGAVLFSDGVVNVDFLDVECTFNRCVDVAGSRCHVDFDVTPPFFS